MKVTTKRDVLGKLAKSVNALNGKTVSVGVHGEHAWLAGIHEYGCVIRPGPGKKCLTVPCNPKAKGKKAKEIPGLVVMKSKEGRSFLGIPNKDGDEDKPVEAYFLLLKKVTIPARPFLGPGFDACHKDVLRQSAPLIGVDAGAYLQNVGLGLMSGIKSYANALYAPPNADSTKTTKKSDNPLNDTGDMIGGIGYEVGK